MAPKIPPPTAATIYVCLQSYATAEGTFQTGMRLRGSHRGVMASPQSWVADGLDDQQMHALRIERFGPVAAGAAVK
jgi:hypothetical protein